jgi:hypothetical protein
MGCPQGHPREHARDRIAESWAIVDSGLMMSQGVTQGASSRDRAGDAIVEFVDLGGRDVSPRGAGHTRSRCVNLADFTE